MLYHYRTGFPFKMNLPKTIKLSYSRHAEQAAKNDRYGNIELEECFSTDGAKIIELETCNETGNPVKLLLERPYDEETNISVAIALNAQTSGGFLVKTVWLNKKDDNHSTVNKNRYQAVEGWVA